MLLCSSIANAQWNNHPYLFLQFGSATPATKEYSQDENFENTYVPDDPTALVVNENYEHQISSYNNYGLGLGLPFGSFMWPKNTFLKNSSIELWLGYNSYGVSGDRDETLNNGGEIYPNPALPYSYTVSNINAMVDYRYNFDLNRDFEPFVTVGAGVDQASTSGYSESACDQSESAASQCYLLTESFASHTQTNFAYEGSAGLDILFSPSFHLTLGYRYFNGGNAVTDPATVSIYGSSALPDNETIEGLSTSNALSEFYVRLVKVV
jgi:opacity protein-like surface antigen